VNIMLKCTQYTRQCKRVSVDLQIDYVFSGAMWCVLIVESSTAIVVMLEDDAQRTITCDECFVAGERQSLVLWWQHYYYVEETLDAPGYAGR
jgi:hypothetical protein